MTVSLMAVLNRELKPVYTMGLRVALARVSHWMKAISSGDGLLHWEQNACQHTSYWDRGGFAHQAEEDRPEGQVADQEDDHQETHHTRQSLLSRYVTLDPGPGLQPQYCQRVIKEIRHGGVCCPRLSCEHQRETQRLFDGELFSWCVQ